ncbi:hypothetical protein SAMN02745121_04660 [Nannocystis exedens]|uniref:Uncharacterized protein n=1 Tax=Nannocystis exedens TaxID=54 RepID=A0A1I2BIJ4_9BACT|nr:hypothetical protein [Nannocystis exedens]PCC67997.1 lipoprotein [Nannocystis exedens]SFE55010.1 hypothetical protein SAMN02745121_04660 [Nannocystis exedens]
MLAGGCEGPDPTASSFAIPPAITAPASTGEAPDPSTGTTSTTVPVPEDSSTSSTGGEASTSTSTTAAAPLQDLGVPDLGDPHPVGCKGKIDFLFVISRYAFMDVMQARLIEAFPYFMETIESKFADFDYHIMVIDPDETWGHPLCNEDCSPEGCSVPDYPCEAVAELTACDTTLGAGTVFPAGKGASNHDCGLLGGRRYFTREQPDPVGTFACMAQVGLNGDAELGEAVTAAVSPALNGPGGCNEGFIRDDALLMITFISNTLDTDSEGKPKLWAEAITNAKHGDPSSVVMFSIQEPECDPWDTVCDLVKYYFPYWYIADNDDEDYRPGFDVATDRISEACSAFIPQ